MSGIFNTVPEVSVEDLKKVIDRHDQIVLLDVRTPGEFARGALLNSINIPVAEVEQRVQSRIADKNIKVYVYCLSGSRSSYAVSIMMKLGYTHVYDVSHGLLAWRAKGYTVP